MSEKIYGIDMGTNSIKIYQKSAGVVVHQKNMIAMVKKNEPMAVRRIPCMKKHRKILRSSIRS